jgi:monofunctional biosynthetic peptidoglycan transglycosylase
LAHHQTRLRAVVRYTLGVARKKMKSLRRWAWRLAAAAAALVVVTLLVVWVTWPDVAALAKKNPQTTAFIETAKARGEQVQWRWVGSNHISIELKKAVLVAEDLSFFSHNGFDTFELKLAIREAVRGDRVRGASTITQQLAKNLWLTPSRSPFRKLREFVLTRQLEQHLSKRRILEIYLNVAQFGPEIYGAEAAARSYFRVPADSLTTDQAAQLAAGLPRPSTWHPGVSTKGYNKAVSRIRLRAGQCDWLDRLL